MKESEQEQTNDIKHMVEKTVEREIHRLEKSQTAAPKIRNLQKVKNEQESA